MGEFMKSLLKNNTKIYIGDYGVTFTPTKISAYTKERTTAFGLTLVNGKYDELMFTIGDNIEGKISNGVIVNYSVKKNDIKTKFKVSEICDDYFKTIYCYDTAGRGDALVLYVFDKNDYMCISNGKTYYINCTNNEFTTITTGNKSIRTSSLFNPINATFLPYKSIQRRRKDGYIATFKPIEGWMHPFIKMAGIKHPFSDVSFNIFYDKSMKYVIHYTMNEHNYSMVISIIDKKSYIRVRDITEGEDNVWVTVIPFSIGNFIFPHPRSTEYKYIDTSVSLFHIFICDLYMHLFAYEMIDPSGEKLEVQDISKEKKDPKYIEKITLFDDIPEYEYTYNSEDDDLEIFSEDREWYSNTDKASIYADCDIPYETLSMFFDKKLRTIDDLE